MAAPALSEEECRRRIEAVEECLQEGFPAQKGVVAEPTAIGEASRRMNVNESAFRKSLGRAKSLYGLEPDWTLYRPRRAAAPFTLDSLPDDGEPDARTLIAQLTARHAQRKMVSDASRLREVSVHHDGPIGVAFFGDPHVDDPGCAWGDLERDVTLCRETPGVLAVNVGDMSNNWVGRLVRLYADQEITAKQSLVLIEWLMTSLPWLLTIKGNHDVWNTEKGDPADYIHRIAPGLLADADARMRITLPGGAAFTMHVRHDFPGNSQFSPGHALVRETLFGYRDHILACGHRHHTGYIPFWHNDPARLCHGFRVGAYKDMDHYARDKGLRECNWARSMGAVIDPDHAADPVRFVKPFFSLAEMAEYLTWRREKWSLGYRKAA